MSPQPSLLAAVLAALAARSLRPTAPLGQPPTGRAKTSGKQAVPQLF